MMPDDDVVIRISYEKIINPVTRDNVLIYVLLLEVCIVGLLLIEIYNRKKVS